jgi:hypothetical protein
LPWLLTYVFVSTTYGYFILNPSTFGLGRMQNIWLKMSMEVLAYGLGLVVEGGVHKLLA